LSIATPVVKTGGTVTFTAGAASAGNSTITGTTPVAADGATASTITITLKDADNNPVSGATPTLSVTGSNKTLGACSATNACGASTCSLYLHAALPISLSIATPVVKTGGTVTFTAGAASAGNSTITGTTPVAADGATASTIT